MNASGQTPKNRANGRVLIVDDHPDARESTAFVLRQAGHTVECCCGAAEALARTAGENFDVVVTDLNMPGMDGLEFIKQLQTRRFPGQVIMMTAYATVATAVEAMRHGAFDYIEKPFSADRIEQLVARALQHGRMLRQAEAARAEELQPAMIGSSRAMQQLRQRILQIGPTPVTVLIIGESGTGKELVARALHASSPRRDKPLVSLNCPALSAQLMESELFGHEKGAFTGADSTRVGRFEAADGGTILLDEVTEIDLNLQAKLLRVLQERAFERVGSSRTLRVDVRVLATTNRNLQAEVAAGRFREDLFFRLAVVPLVVPPLRERREDIPELAQYFFDRCAERLSRDPCMLEPAATELLMEYHWPGNVRELENLVTRAAVLNTGQPVAADELQRWIMALSGDVNASGRRSEPPAAQSASIPIESISLQEMERRLIEATLERFGGHRAKTAEALGIGVRTLTGKLRQYGYAPREKSFAQR